MLFDVCALTRTAEGFSPHNAGVEKDQSGCRETRYWANRHCESAFLPTEVISSDFCRVVVDDDENSLDATDDAFDLVHKIAEKWLDFLNSDHQIEL